MFSAGECVEGVDVLGGVGGVGNGTGGRNAENAEGEEKIGEVFGGSETRGMVRKAGLIHAKMLNVSKAYHA